MMLLKSRVVGTYCSTVCRSWYNLKLILSFYFPLLPVNMSWSRLHLETDKGLLDGARPDEHLHTTRMSTSYATTE